MPSPAEVPSDALRRIGAFFALSPSPPERAVDLGALLTDPAEMEAVLDLYARRLSTTRRDIAGSLFFQGWAGRVVSVHLGCRALTSRAPDLGPDNLVFAFPEAGPVQLALRDRSLPARSTGWTRLLAEHLAPLVGAVDERAATGGRRLWGNLASAYAGALIMLRRNGFRPSMAMPTELVDFGDWSGDGHYVRRTCCNLFRVEGYAVCGDCVIPRDRA